METDLPGDGRFVLTERSGNSGLGRIVANTDLDDPSFIEGDVKMLIRRSHKRYLLSLIHIYSNLGTIGFAVGFVLMMALDVAFG